MKTSAHTAEHWLFCGCNSEDVEVLLSAGKELRFEPGEVIFREGEPADGLYFVAAGSVRVSATGDAGETILALVYANDILGELGVLDGQPRSARATAAGFCVAYFVPTEPFLDVLERSPDLCMRLLVLLTRRLRVANGRLGELAATTTLVRSEEEPGEFVIHEPSGDTEKLPRPS